MYEFAGIVKPSNVISMPSPMSVVESVNVNPFSIKATLMAFTADHEVPFVELCKYKFPKGLVS